MNEQSVRLLSIRNKQLEADLESANNHISLLEIAIKDATETEVEYEIVNLENGEVDVTITLTKGETVSMTNIVIPAHIVKLNEDRLEEFIADVKKKEIQKLKLANRK